MISRTFAAKFLVLAIGVAGAGLAHGGTNRPTTVTAKTAAEFATQAAQIREEIKPGGRYGGISPSDRDVVEQNLGTIASLLQKKSSVESLSDEERVALFNAQERANAILTNNEKNRLICTYEAKSGTHFKQTLCQTQAERELARTKSQDGYRNELMKGGALQRCMRGPQCPSGM